METKPLVLVAEDDSSNYRYLEVLLRKQFYVLWAQDGEIAVQMALENDVKMIFMDNKMPKKTGLKALVEIKKIKPTLPIIMQTAFAFDGDKEEAMAMGADGYLTKPIMSRDLKEVIAQFFGEL